MSRRTGLVVAALLAAVVYGLIMLLSRFREPVGFGFYGLVWLFVVHLGLWALFTRIDAALERRWPWPEDAIRRTAVFIAVAMTAGIAAFDGIYVVLRLVEVLIGAGDGELSIGHMLTSTGLGAILSAVVGAVVLARGNLARWQDAENKVRALKEERAALELGALRRQLDPHFLFNSLNTLASLISEAPETAADFVEELAEVYRYVLRSARQELVPLGDELRSVRSLAFLLEKRFERSFRFEVDVEPETLHKQIVPLALHTLLENAVQHNTLTPENPLVVTLESTRNGARQRLTMRNPRRPKPSRRHGGVGLGNLRRSYEILGGDFAVETDDGSFVVTLELLDVERYTSDPETGGRDASGDRRG